MLIILRKYCASVSFIPEFNEVSTDDAYAAYVEENELQNDEFTF
jgi:hypothetical protein